MGNRMTLEEQYAAQWKKDAYSEGHRRGLPPGGYSGGSIRTPEGYDYILQAIKNGATSIIDVSNRTGYSYNATQKKLLRLSKDGKIVKAGNQWRIEE